MNSYHLTAYDVLDTYHVLLTRHEQLETGWNWVQMYSGLYVQPDYLTADPWDVVWGLSQLMEQTARSRTR